MISSTKTCSTVQINHLTPSFFSALRDTVVQVSKKVVGSILTLQVVSVCSPAVSVGSLLRRSDFQRSPTSKDMHAKLISNSDGHDCGWFFVRWLTIQLLYVPKRKDNPCIHRWMD